MLNIFSCSCWPYVGFSLEKYLFRFSTHFKNWIVCLLLRCIFSLFWILISSLRVMLLSYFTDKKKKYSKRWGAHRIRARLSNSVNMWPWPHPLCLCLVGQGGKWEGWGGMEEDNRKKHVLLVSLLKKGRLPINSTSAHLYRIHSESGI